MKTGIIKLMVGLAVFTVGTWGVGAADELTDRLQRGLLEEEANLNYAAAITNYQDVVRQADAQRRVVATAIFRLAECYRKLGRTNEAQAYYERVLRDFSDQPNLVALSRQHAGTAAPAGQQPLISPLVSPEDTELSRLQKLLETSPDLINAPDNDGVCLLHKAARQGQVRVAEFLLGKGAEVDRKNRLGETPLMAATQAGHKAMVERLLERGADVNAQSVDGTTALHHAAGRGYTLLVKTLVEHRAQIDGQNDKGRTPLLESIDKKESAAARVLLEAKANPRLLEKNGMGVMSLAVVRGQTNLLPQLVQAGAEVNPPSPAFNPLREAIRANEGPVALWLLDHDASAALGDIANDSLIVLALELGQVDVAMALIQKGADVNNPGPSRLRQMIPVTPVDNKTPIVPLHYAAAMGRMDLLQSLLNHQAKVDAPDFRQATPLHYAVWKNQTNAMLTLIQKGAAIDALGYWCPQEFSPEGKNVSIWQFTPVGVAIYNKNPMLVDLLLSHGADPNGLAWNSERFSPFYLSVLTSAIEGKKTEVLKAVLAHKPMLDRPDKSGLIALFSAMNQRNYDAIRLLLEAGANSNVSNHDGMDPLSYVIRNGDIQAAELLLSHGANPNVLDPQGLSPLAFVQTVKSGQWKFDHQPEQANVALATELEDLLRRHGANEFFTRRLVMGMSRPGLSRWSNPQKAFLRSTNDWNRFTLLELLAAVYSGDGQYLPGGLGSAAEGVVPGQEGPRVPRSLLAFPDFKRVTLSRVLPGDKALTNLTANAEEMLQENSSVQDPWLEWGDDVQLPEADHLLGEIWTGLSPAQRRAFQDRLKRQIKVKIKDQIHELTLVPTMVLTSSPGRRPPPMLDMVDLTVPSKEATNPVPVTAVTNFWIGPVLQQSKVLRASSDQSRVKVKRREPQTGQEREFIIDLTQGKLEDTLWLREGDVIEVPER